MSDWLQIAPNPRIATRLAVLTNAANPEIYALVLRAALDAAGVENECLGLDVPLSDFRSCVNHLKEAGFRGVLAVGAHRVEAAQMAEKFFVARNSMGVANALSFQNGVFAQNTEIAAIDRLLDGVEPAKALVLGSGAAARSAIMALLDKGWKVRLWNRSALKARPMLTLYQRWGQVELVYQPDPVDCRLVVNCTPLGMRAGESPPLLWQHVRPKTVFLDFVYRRVSTEFLRNAAGRGLKTIDGRQVIVESAALALEWLTEATISREVMVAAIIAHANA